MTNAPGRVLPHVPSDARCCSTHSSEPSSSRRPTTRTTATSRPGRASCAFTDIGGLGGQLPPPLGASTVTPARPTKANAPSASRSCTANCISFLSISHVATMDTSIWRPRIVIHERTAATTKAAKFQKRRMSAQAVVTVPTTRALDLMARMSATMITIAVSSSATSARRSASRSPSSSAPPTQSGSSGSSGRARRVGSRILDDAWCRRRNVASDRCARQQEHLAHNYQVAIVRWLARLPVEDRRRQILRPKLAPRDHT